MSNALKTGLWDGPLHRWEVRYVLGKYRVVFRPWHAALVAVLLLLGAACGGDSDTVATEAAVSSTTGANVTTTTGGNVTTTVVDGGGDSPAQPAAGAGDIGLEPLTRRGNLSITVTSPRVSSRIEGACGASNSRVEFISDDGSTRFMVFTGDAVGAAGEVTAEVEGESLTWVAAADSETSTAQTDRTSAYYEGDFIRGGDVAFAVVQIRCNE